MRINNLTIYVKSDTIGVTSSDFRKTILALTDNMSESDKKMINLHYEDEDMEKNNIRKIPYVLFGKPHKNSFKLFSYGDDGYELLNRIKKNLRYSFSVKGKEFEIKDVSILKQDIIPKASQSPIVYKTVTPLILFTGGEKKFTTWLFNNVKDSTEKNKLLQAKALEVIQKNIKYQMRTLFKDKEYNQFDNIEIKWDTFKTIWIKSRDKKELGVVGDFTSNYDLPRFIGRKIGNGFGELGVIKENVS